MANTEQYLSALEDQNFEYCPKCLEEIEPEAHACPGCGARFHPHTVGYWWSAEPMHMYAIMFDGVDVDALVDELLSHDGSIEKLQTGVKEAENTLLRIIDDEHRFERVAKVLLAYSGVDYRKYESEEVLECEVCEQRFRLTATQEHHISYVHDFTIRVCYSCHRRIHHEDGYYDDLQPNISRDEAEKLKETGYTENNQQ